MAMPNGSDVKLPDAVQRITAAELAHLAVDPSFDLHPQRRIDLYDLLGPSSGKANSQFTVPHNPTTADRVRTRLALLTAEKVVPLWELACRETDAKLDCRDSAEEEAEQRLQRRYAKQRPSIHPAEISVSDVPRASCPMHILELARLVINKQYDHFSELCSQANEWWQVYPRPEGMERECFVKWAAQEALYQALGWNSFSTDLPSDVTLDDRIGMANWHPDGPAGRALLAYAAVFDPDRFRWDNDKRREFWRWWLADAIPQAWRLEDRLDGLH